MYNFIKRFCLILSFVFLFSIPVYADKSTYYEDIYTLDQYTTIRQLMDDSHFKPSTDVINSFLNNKTYTKKYIVSFCNSGNCEADKNSRSIALIGFGDDITADFVQENRNLKLNLSGSDDAKLFFYHNTGALPVNGTFALSLFNSSKYTTIGNFRGILPCYSVSNVDSILPSMLFDKVFTDLKLKIKDLIFSNLNVILPSICLAFFVPFFLWVIKLLRRNIK